MSTEMQALLLLVAIVLTGLGAGAAWVVAKVLEVLL